MLPGTELVWIRFSVDSDPLVPLGPTSDSSLVQGEASSVRPTPETLPQPEYPSHFETRWVSRCGTHKWRGRQLLLSQALGHEWIGFEEVADGV